MRRIASIIVLLSCAALGQISGGGSGNATSIQGKAVAATTPTSGKCLVFTTSWGPGSCGGGALPFVTPESSGAVGNGAYYFDGSITAGTNAANGSSTAPQTPAIATAVNGSVVVYGWQTNATWSVAPTVGTSQVLIDFPGGGQYGLAVNDQTVATAGAVSAAGGTLSSSTGWNADAVVLTPSGTIAHVGTATSAHESGSTDAVVAVPTGAVDGDVLVAQVAYFNTHVTWPAGWTVLFTHADAGEDDIAAGYIVLSGSVPASYTWTGSTGRTVGVVAYSNVASAHALSTLSSATAAFTTGAVGDPVCTGHTSAGGTGEQCGSIAGYISSTAAFVDYVALSTPTGIWFGYGHDDSAAFTTMLSSAPCSTVGCRVALGPNGYVLTSSYTLPPNITQQFQGAGAGIPNTTNSFNPGDVPANANTGSRLMFLTRSLTKAAITIGGTAGVTSVAAWDRLADLSLIAGAGRGKDGGGANGIDILNWQDASLDRVIVANFLGDGVYVDGMTEGSNQEYISVIGFDQLYPIWNHGAGLQVGSSIAVNNLETISFNNGISEGNDGPGIKLQGNIQGFTAFNNIIQWNNAASPSGKSEIEIDNDIQGGCNISANYFEVDDGDAHPITPGVIGCNATNNYIGGNDSAQSRHTGINNTAPGAVLTVQGGIAAVPYQVIYSTTPVLDLNASSVQQFACTTAAAAISPTISNLVAGQVFDVIFVQNGTTACTWTWPSAIHGGGTVTGTLSGISTQQFVVSATGTDAYAVGAIQSTTGGTP